MNTGDDSLLSSLLRELISLIGKYASALDEFLQSPLDKGDVLWLVSDVDVSVFRSSEDSCELEEVCGSYLGDLLSSSFYRVFYKHLDTVVYNTQSNYLMSSVTELTEDLVSEGIVLEMLAFKGSEFAGCVLTVRPLLDLRSFFLLARRHFERHGIREEIALRKTLAFLDSVVKHYDGHEIFLEVYLSSSARLLEVSSESPEDGVISERCDDAFLSDVKKKCDRHCETLRDAVRSICKGH